MTAWAIQALRDDFEITLATLGRVDFPALNRGFGTSLRESDVDVRVAPENYRRVPRMVPTQGALLEIQLNVRWARALDRERRFDILFSTQNEADFGRCGIQYVHYPGWYLPRPDFEMRWFHKIPAVLASYRKLCLKSTGATVAGLGRNVHLANSRFVAERIHAVHGGDATVIHPPVPGEFPTVPWEQRRDAFTGVGRFSIYKRWPMAVRIIDAVRARGHDIGFTLIGQIGNPADVHEKKRLEKMRASRPWFRILSDLPRAELTAEIAAHRYGIHTMEEEHFGIAVAELQRAGCVTFVHNSGGPVEIVGYDTRLTFDNEGEAAAKIVHAVEDRATSESLRTLVASRRDCFSAERFCDAIRETVWANGGKRSRGA